MSVTRRKKKVRKATPGAAPRKKKVRKTASRPAPRKKKKKRPVTANKVDLAAAASTNGEAAPANGSAAGAVRRRRATAKTMAASQRDISVSEFFAKNRHLLGFDNPRKALLTTVKEAVDNSLDACDDLSWFMGTFRSDSDDSPPGYAAEREDANDWTFDTRLAWLPYYDEPSGGRYLVHVGGSYSYRNTVDPAEFGTKAWIGGQAPIGVGAVAQDDEYHQLGGEFAVVWGAFSLSSEYYQAWVPSGESYDGAYVQASYFLTGEHRGYKKAGKVFDRVHPLEPAFWVDTLRGSCFGRGAWEVAAAYSYSDMRDGQDIQAGVEERALVDGFIVGVNWYLNPYSRIMFDYNLESTDFVDAGTPDSTANLFGVRWQVDW